MPLLLSSHSLRRAALTHKSEGWKTVAATGVTFAGATFALGKIKNVETKRKASMGALAAGSLLVFYDVMMKNGGENISRTGWIGAGLGAAGCLAFGKTLPGKNA